MKSLVSVIAVALISASTAYAQSFDTQPADLTRADSATIPADASERGRDPGARLPVTRGEVSTGTAGDVFTARDRALLGLDATAPVTVTRFVGTPDTAQAYTAR